MSNPISDEVDLHRLTIDEAAEKLDKYLHDAYVAGYSSVRVVHGKGTGVLRIMVSRELAGHPLVSSHRPGGRGEGGDGVTVVELA
ncbi:Smr/MutS family protein [Chloroflexota bacterium]